MSQTLAHGIDSNVSNVHMIFNVDVNYHAITRRNITYKDSMSCEQFP